MGLATFALTGCGEEGAAGPETVKGDAGPVPGDSSGGSSKKGGATSPSSPSAAQGGRSGGGGAVSPGAPGKGGTGSSGTQGGSGNGGGGTGGGGGGTGSCKTDQLAFSTSNGMGEGALVVNLRNTGSAACTLKGFPGVDLQGEAGSLNADRTDAAPPSVSVAPGESTHFTLNYPPNNSGGSGATFSSILVTPPNETRSQSVPVTINLPVSDGSTSSRVTVTPVGAG